MKTYIPSESFVSQYPEWASLGKKTFKKLPASRGLKQAGALLFLEGALSEIKAMPDRPGFACRVDDTKAYGTSVWVDPASNSLEFECGCARRRKGDWCSHALALVAAIDYLFFERNHLPLSPLSDVVNKLAAGIDQSKGQKSNKILRRIRMRGLQDGSPYLEGDTAFNDSFVQAFNPYGEMRRLARNTLDLPVHDYDTTLRTLVDYVRDIRSLSLEAESADGFFIKLEPELVEISARLHFRADNKSHLIRAEEAAEALTDEEILARLGARHFILKDGRIAKLNEQRNQQLLYRLLGAEIGFTDFSRRANEIPINPFNIGAMRLPAEEMRLLRQGHFHAGQTEKKNEAPEEQGFEDLPSLQMSASLELRKVGDTHKTRYEAIIEGKVGEESYSLGGIFHDFEAKLLSCARDSNRLLGRRTRYLEILAAAAHLPTLKTEAARRKFINKVSKRAIFAKPEHKRAVGQFLRQIERDYCRPKSACVPLCLAEDPLDEDSPYHWQAVNLPLPGVLALTARLFLDRSEEHYRPEAPFSLLLVPSEETIRALFEACQQFGISLRIDDKVAALRTASVKVLFTKAGEIDWFELKPSIRCDDFTIPEEDWERLLRGNLLLQAEDGSWVAPVLHEPEGLRSLMDTMTSPSSRKEQQQVHRLQLLDWLELRKKGVKVEMPREIDALLESLRAFQGIPTQALPAGIQAELRPYQQAGFEWLCFLHAHRLGACLADDMGLGKTLQALCFLGHLRAQFTKKRGIRALAVLPTSLVFNWQSEAARFLPDLKVAAFSGTDRDPEVFETHELILTSYDLLWRDDEQFLSHHFDLVIFDEAQALKNPQSRRRQTAAELDRDFTLCLTGTPMENHPGEYHSIMDIALPGLMGPRKAFDEAMRAGDDRVLRRARPFVLRRSKAAILTELPPKVETDIQLEMDQDQRGLYTRIIDELRKEIDTAYREQTKAQAGICALAALTKLRQICVSPELIGRDISGPPPKIQYLADSLIELREEGQSVLVFSQFVKVLNLVEAQLQAAGINALRLDGSTPAKARKGAVERFQGSEDAEVFLISLKAGGVGLNLTRASHVFHIDPWWNPSVENQASDRAHRIGQTNTVFIQRLIMRDSIEEKIMALKAQKKKLFDAIVGEADTGKQGKHGLKKEDFDFLFS